MKTAIKSLLLGTLFTLAGQVWAVNINTADAQVIADSITGVGLKKAEAIVAYRTENGNFKDLASLTQVKGIGEKTLEKNKENIEF